MSLVRLNESAMNTTLHDSYWRVSAFESVTSTQSELSAKKDLKHGEVFVSEFQSAGKGRLDRKFDAVESSALLVSIYIEPKVEKDLWSAFPLLAGLSTLEALIELDENFQGTLKWPNDLLINENKVAGILVEAKEFGLIIGIGLNVSMQPSQLPVSTATSLAIEKFLILDRNIILPKILRAITRTVDLWESGSKSPFDQYRKFCSSLEKKVEISLPNGSSIRSTAIGITELGELVLASGERLSIGDVIHLR